MRFFLAKRCHDRGWGLMGALGRVRSFRPSAALSLLVACSAACGDVPRAPMQIAAPVQIVPEAGPPDVDAGSSDGPSKPTGPLPASMACINCALNSCFDD